MGFIPAGMDISVPENPIAYTIKGRAPEMLFYISPWTGHGD
jgi:hypothetical protein